MSILEQQEWTLDNAPTKDIKFNRAKPPKPGPIARGGEIVKNVIDTGKKAIEVSSGTIERAFSGGMDKVTIKEVNEEWIPYFLKTGNLKILNQKTKGKSKSFLADLRSWGWILPEIRNHFYKEIKEKKNQYPKHFRYIKLLNTKPPRTQAEALALPDNVNKLNIKQNKWARQAMAAKKKPKKSAFESWWNDAKQLSRDTWRSLTKETNTMNNDDIRTLIKEAFTDKVYGQYPYSHRSGDEEEPKEDYVEEWKRFCMEMVQDKSKERAIAIAKLLVKDVELFEDVLDLAGQNQSVGSEILRKMQKSEEV